MAPKVQPRPTTSSGAKCLFISVVLAGLLLAVTAQSAPTDASKANILIQWGRGIGKMGQPTSHAAGQAAPLQGNGFGFGKSSTSNYAIGPTPVGLLDDFTSIPTNADHYWHATTSFWTITAVKTGTSIRWFLSGAIFNRYEQYESVWLPSPVDISSSAPQVLTGNVNIATVRATSCTVVVGVLGASNTTLSVYTWRLADSQFYCEGNAVLGRVDDNLSNSPNAKIVDSMPLPAAGAYFLDCGKFFCTVSDNASTIYYWGHLSENTTVNSAATPSSLAGMPSETFNMITISAYNIFMRLTNGTWLAWGDNEYTWVSTNAVADLIAYHLPMPSDVIDMSCGSGFCLMRVSVTDASTGLKSTLLQSFGTNDFGQLGGNGWYGDSISGSNNLINATRAMEAFGGAQNVAKFSTVVQTAFALLTDGSLWVWGANSDYYNNDLTAPAISGIIDSPNTGLLTPQKVPLPAGCIPLEPPFAHGVSWESYVGAITMRCYVSNVANLKSSLSAPAMAPIPGPSESYRQAIIAWGATAQRSLDAFSRPIDDFLSSNSTDSFHGLPMANASVHSAALFAPYPYIMNLPMDYAWSKVQAGQWTVFASGSPLGSSTPSFNPGSPVNQEITVPDAGYASNPNFQDIFTWGALKANPSLLSSTGNNHSRSVPLIPFAPNREMTLIADIFAAPLKLSPAVIDFGAASNFFVTLNTSNHVTYTIDVNGYEPPYLTSPSNNGYPISVTSASATPSAPSSSTDTNTPGYLGGNSLPRVLCGTAHCAVFLSSTQIFTVASAGLNGLSAKNDYRLCRSDASESTQIPLLVTLPDSGTGAVAVSLGHDFTVIATATNKVYACGTSGSAALSGVTISSGNNLTLIGSLGSPISSLNSGLAHTVILTTNNQVYTFGDNSMGQLGRTSTATIGLVSGLPPSGTIVSVAAVRHTSFAVYADGSVWAWGENSFANLFGSFADSSGIYSSSVPVLATLGPAMKLDVLVQYIASHPTARTVFAISKIRAPTAASTATPSVPLVKFGVDPNQRYLLSPTQPTWYDSKAEIPVFLKSSSERIISASSQYPISWFGTDQSRIYFSVMNSSAAFDTTPELQMFDSRFSSGATKFAPAPVYYGSSSPIVPSKMSAVGTAGVLVGGQGSTCKFLPSKSSSTAPFVVSVLNDCVDFDCSLQGCVVVTSSRTSVAISLSGSSAILSVSTSPITAVTMLSKCFTVGNATTSYCAVAALQNSSFVLIAVDSHLVWQGSLLSNYTTLLSSAADYWIASDGAQLEVAKVSSGLPVASLATGTPVCPASTIKSVSASASSWFATCADGEVYGKGTLPPQNGFLETYNATNSITALTSTDWITYMQLSVPTKLQSFTDLRTNKNLVVTQIVGDRTQPSNYASSVAFYAVMSSPSATTPSAVSRTACSPSSPPTIDPLWFCDDSIGAWKYPGSLTVSMPIIISGSPVIVLGNLSSLAGFQIAVVIDSNSQDPYINVGGCANLSTPIQVQMTEENLKGLSSSGQKVLVLESNSNCGDGLLSGLKASGNHKGCKKWDLKPQTVNTGPRTQLYAVISVTSNTCNRWWIILVSVLGGIVILVAIALIVAFNSPLKHKIMPYKDSNAHI